MKRMVTEEQVIALIQQYAPASTNVYRHKINYISDGGGAPASLLFFSASPTPLTKTTLARGLNPFDNNIWGLHQDNGLVIDTERKPEGATYENITSIEFSIYDARTEEIIVKTLVSYNFISDTVTKL